MMLEKLLGDALNPRRKPARPSQVTWFEYNDGGRKAAGYTGLTRDCVVRAMAIAMRRPYAEVYADMADLNAKQRYGKRMAGKADKGKRTARNGVFTTKTPYKRYMAERGWVWVPTMRIGSGCTVHLHPDELPEGRLIVAVSRHYTAVIDGWLQDTHDCSRGGTRCVYGYWHKP